LNKVVLPLRPSGSAFRRPVSVYDGQSLRWCLLLALSGRRYRRSLCPLL